MTESRSLQRRQKERTQEALAPGGPQEPKRKQSCMWKRGESLEAEEESQKPHKTKKKQKTRRIIPQRVYRKGHRTDAKGRGGQSIAVPTGNQTRVRNDPNN